MRRLRVPGSPRYRFGGRLRSHEEGRFMIRRRALSLALALAGVLLSAITATGEVLGAEDLAILGDQLYASIDGGGEAHGNADQPSGVYRILADGTADLVADLSA